jgi:hypothetical protein
LLNSTASSAGGCNFGSQAVAGLCCAGITGGAAEAALGRRATRAYFCVTQKRRPERSTRATRADFCGSPKRNARLLLRHA